MDLLDFDLVHDAEEGMDLHLKNPRTGEPQFMEDGRPVTITIAGMHSDTYRSAVHDANKVFFGWPAAMLESPLFRAQREAADIGVLVAVTFGWQGIKHDGVMLDFNETAAAAVYRRFGWIRDQVADAVRDPKAFPPTRSDWKPPVHMLQPAPQPDFSKW